MRAERPLLLAALFFLSLLGPACRAEAQQADTTGIQLSRLTVEPIPERPQAAASIDVTALRKLGAASLEEVIRLHRAAVISVLPISGPTEGSLALPDGGGSIRLLTPLVSGQRATDEHLIGSLAYGWGAPWMAFALDDPRAGGVEALDLDTLRFPLERASFRGPGEALTRLDPRGPAFADPGDTTGRGISRTTLVYQRGDGNAQLAGIRLLTTAFHRSVYASYTKNDANGWAPLLSAKTSRYGLRAELGSLASHRFELEGVLHERSIEDSVSAEIPYETPGRNEWDRRHVALTASHTGKRFTDSWRFGIGKEKETWLLSTDLNLSPDAGTRERWEFPTMAAEGILTWRPDSRVTWITSIRAASRKLLYQRSSLPEFEARHADARAHAGVRLALGPEAGAGLDAAYDVRETQVSFWDARGSLWAGASRLHGRLDLESAHDRPTWVDLLTPLSAHDFSGPTGIQSSLIRSGNPNLKPRRLTGPLGSAVFSPLQGLDLELSGSYRRVTDDFGWNVSVDTLGTIYDVLSIATRRGSGWVSHGALGWEFRRGPLRLRGVGWVRGGPDWLSPQAGSPPRRAVEAAASWRLVLFQGDLPLRFEVLSHARGPRRGLIREPGQVTWDGSVSADFGSAGAFLRMRDVFDRRAGSAIWDPALPSGAPTPGRAIQFGVSWNLLD